LTTAAVTLSDNRVSGDLVTVSYTTDVFVDKNVGTGKTVTVSGISISGADAANYTLASLSTTTTANITARILTVTAAASNKTYDGSTAATVTLSDDRVSGDLVTTSYSTAVFPDKNVGTGKIVTVSGISISGTDAANYTLASASTTTTANITARTLTVSVTTSNKTYDGTSTALVTFSDDRVSGDLLTTSYSTAVFADKNVGIGKTVTVSGISISGTDASNYTLASASTTTTASITGRTLTVTAAASNKIYDGLTTAAVTLSDDRVSGDLLTTSYSTAVFVDKNVGTGKTVTVSGISISGTDAANYTLASASTTITASITAKTLTVTATAQDKTYDGSTAATVTLSDNRVSGDLVTVLYTSAVFSDKNVGTGKAVTVSGISISGADASNYTLASASTSTTASITARVLAITATASNKIYDGLTTAAVTLSDNRVSGDLLTVSYTSAVFADKNVGTGKTVTVSGISISGTDAQNYTLAGTSTTTTANIITRTLTVTATASNKTYDGSTTAAVTLSDDRVSGDLVTVSYTSAVFADKNVGTGKTVTVSGITISGADAANYSLTGATVTTLADITKRAITITADAKSKTYGDADPAFTAQVTAGTIQGTDIASGSLTRTLGENVGSYAITQGSYTYGSNYTETYISANLTITKRAITIAADAKSKTYGDSDPIFTVQIISGTIQGTDVASGSLSRISGENVGSYAISQGTYTYGTNYVESYVPSNLTITQRAITIAADVESKIYGNSDPALTAQVTVGTIHGTDLASGSLTRVSGENVGSYTINQGSYSYGSNYVETYVSANLTIAKRAITISADAKSKTYGDVDPTFTAQVTVGTIQGTDAASGSLTRISGENVGIYAINQGTYTYGTNYTETFVPANLTITKIVNVITFAAIATKTYGDAAFTLSATASSGLAVTYTSDNMAVATVSGNTITVVGAGTAHIIASQPGNNIYAAAADIAQTLIVNKRNITINADAKYKTYGDVDPGFTSQVISGSIQGTDLATGALVRMAGENVGAYTINQGTYTYGSNYAETFVSGTLTITQRAITITADAKSKTYGDADPAFTVQITSGSIPGTDVVSGSLTRASGENTGSYTINQGSYSYGPNYVEIYVPANLTIGQRSITITADAKSKTYGDTDPVLTAQVTVGTIQGTDAASGLLTRVSGENVGAYAINKNTYTYGGNYNETFVPENLTITQRAITITADTESKTYGDADPALTAKVTAGTIQGTDVVTGELVRQSGETVGVYAINQGTYTYGSNYAETFVPASFTINRRIITFTITNELSACENTNIEIDYTILKGTPILYKLTFDASANAQGIQNVAYTSLPSTSTDGIIPFSIPKGVSYGVYTGTLQMQDRLGAESDSYPFQFTINMSSDYIISKYDDVVALDNSSNIFASYQWYKDGLIIDGATEQFYNDLSGLVGVYFAKVTTVDGKTYITCSKKFDIPLKKKSVRAYPSLLASNQVCTVQVDGFSESELQGASLSVYTAQGICVYRIPKVETLNSLSLSVPQIYIGHITLKSGKDYVFKVIVAN
jgi:hypothetical protein